MLISPAEPAALRARGTVSSLPERMGVDFLWSVNGEWWGVQRKTVSDLIASAQDGRISKEIGQMKARIEAGNLHAVLILEGVTSWTNEGVMLGSSYGRAWTRPAFLGLLWSIRAAGIWVELSRSLEDTWTVIGMLESWSNKSKHSTAEARPGPIVAWGTATNRDWQVHFLMGMPSVGAETAKAILDMHGMPFAWRVTEKELRMVPGVGPKIVKQMTSVVPMVNDNAAA